MTGVRVEAASFYGDHGPAGRTVEHSKMVDGRLVLVRYCGYCWAEYVETKAHRAYSCSALCTRRMSAWNSWVRETRHAAIHGNIGQSVAVKSAPAGGASLFDSVARFDVAISGVEVAA